MNARTTLRQRLEQGPPVLAPVCLDPLAARLIEQLGFGAGYLSGGALGFSLAVSEALLTVTEIATATRQITQRSALPLIVDIGVGFGDAVHVSRTIREAEAAGAVRRGADAGELAAVTRLPPRALDETLARASRFQAGRDADPYGRDFTARPALAPPYFAAQVTGALFHTQGGLMIDRTAAVRRAAGDTLPNLFAGGGAACGVSGPELAGYLSGNGLLTAIAFGALAGIGAARCAGATAHRRSARIAPALPTSPPGRQQ